MNRVNWLATDILTALGARTDVSGAGVPGASDPVLAATWLRVHDIRDLYVQFAWDISFPALRGAVDLARIAGVHPWLVGDSPYSDYHSEKFTAHQARQWTGEEFLTHWRHLVDEDPGRDDPEPNDHPASLSPASGNSWPTALPDDDFTTFRAACRDRLSKREFAVVDDAFLTVIDDATAILIPVLRTIPPVHPARSRQHPRRGRVREQAWRDGSLALGRRRVAPALQVTVRAAQVAAFNVGYLIQIDLDRFIGMATPPRAERNATPPPGCDCTPTRSPTAAQRAPSPPPDSPPTRCRA